MSRRLHLGLGIQPGDHFDHDPAVARVAHDAEAGLEVLPGIEVGRHPEFLLRDGRVAHAAQNEGADGVALDVMGQPTLPGPATGSAASGNRKFHFRP